MAKRIEEKSGRRRATWYTQKDRSEQQSTGHFADGRSGGLSPVATEHCDLVDAIANACERATGNRHTITPNLLKSVEEHGEVIPYRILCLIADGLGCDPVDILPIEEPGDETGLPN